MKLKEILEKINNSNFEVIGEVFKIKNDLENTKEKLYAEILNYIIKKIKRMDFDYLKADIEDLYFENVDVERIQYFLEIKIKDFKVTGNNNIHNIYYKNNAILEERFCGELHVVIYELCRKLIKLFNVEDKIEIEIEMDC